jgi:hypothetical protein
MPELFFRPFKGVNYKFTKTLILSESTYDWREGNEIASPQPDHPELSLQYGIKSGKIAYFRQMGRALCESNSPSPEIQRKQWDRFAYSVYVQKSVGFGAGKRPSQRLWKEAGQLFMEMLEDFRPTKVIFTGRDLWERGSLPDCHEWLLADIQAYKLKDRSLVWCMALPHPANRREGFDYEKVGASIRNFVASRFPSKASANRDEKRDKAHGSLSTIAPCLNP